MDTYQDKDEKADQEERRLWLASRRYMNGDLSVEGLEEVEHPHAQTLKKAIVKLSRRSIGKIEPIQEKRADEEERHLWRASRNYMKGEIGVKDLEEVERQHTRDFRKAIIKLAQRNLKHQILRFLHIKRGPLWMFI